jgi:hypothetical protein
MKKVFFVLLASLLFSNFCYAQDDLTPAQLKSISKLMKEIKDMSKKNKETIIFEFLITNGEYSLKNVVIQKDKNWINDADMRFAKEDYNDMEKHFTIFCSRGDVMICDKNEETEVMNLGYGVMGCEAACESKSCYRIVYIP